LKSNRSPISNPVKVIVPSAFALDPIQVAPVVEAIAVGNGITVTVKQLLVSAQIPVLQPVLIELVITL